MKKNLSMLVLISGLIFLGTSCKKKIYGCMDETATNYSSIATEDLQNCTYAVVEEQEVLASNTVSINWANQGTYWSATLLWAEITATVVNNGGLTAFIGATGEWTQLPYTVFETGYQTNVFAYFTQGQVDLEWSDSDGTLPNFPSITSARLVIYK